MTRPVAGMREAIAGARVGDDVFGDDPTVIELETRVAGCTAPKRRCIVPSGTMGNFIALVDVHVTR